MSLRRVLFVFEFPPGDAEWQLRDVAEGMRRLLPALEISFCAGFEPRYSPGGLRIRRLVNGAWVHLRAFFRVLFGHYDAVLVRSAPPLVQMTVAAACRLRGVPYWVWLMDAHPEIEAQLWGRRLGVGGLFRWLAQVNQACLHRAALVIVLDRGMRKRLVPGLNDDRVIVCPTWGRETAPAPTLDSTRERGPGLRLVYLGNLGLAHDAPLLMDFLRACRGRGGVSVTFVGTAENSLRALREFAKREGIELASLAHVDFARLRATLEPLKFDFGLVTLAEEFLGLLSPSKFAGYLAVGIPVIYLGPADSNVGLICDRFRAGLRLDRRTLAGGGFEETWRIVRERPRAEWQEGVKNASAHFNDFNGAYLATEILQRAGPPGAPGRRA